MSDEMNNQPQDELSENELDQVTGGAGGGGGAGVTGKGQQGVLIGLLQPAPVESAALGDGSVRPNGQNNLQDFHFTAKP